MDLERLLISKVIFTGRIEEAMARQITDGHFADDECRDMWKYLATHTYRYKSCPGLDVVKHDFPDFEFVQTQESIEWVLDRFTVMVKRRFADNYLIDLGRAADDPERREDIDLEFLRVAQDLIRSLPTGKVSRYSEAEKRVKEYEKNRKAGKKPGIPYGMPTLDNALGGIMPHELVTVLGWTNVGKSTLLRVFSHNIWLQGFTPLYISLEMGDDEILREFDALGAQLDRQRMKQLQLPDEQLKHWAEFAAEIASRDCDIMIVDEKFRVTPEQVYAETLRHKPSCVFIDYVGLMKTAGAIRGTKKYQQLTEITQDLKVNARMLRIPIIMAAQTNRAGAKDGAELENTGDAISISQDADTVIGLFQDEEMEERKEMEIRTNKSRSGPRPKFRMIWDHERPEYREKTMKDMFKRHQEQNGNFTRTA